MTDPDRRLARQARSGDRRALAELYERYRGRVFGFLVRTTGGRQPAEDVFQEVWIKVLQGIQGFHPTGSFRAWLFRIAANAAVDRLRRESLRVGPELDAPAGEDGERRIDLIASSSPGPDREGTSKLLGREIARGLRTLPERQRTAVLLRHQQGLSYSELAACLDVPEGTAKVLVHRGVTALRERLYEWADE
jgi:RNA polymerase sigma-70 factor (ECF subfamily)